MAETKEAKEKAAAATQPALAAGALAMLAKTLGDAARVQALSEHGEQVHVDHTVPGGRYKGVDGRIHDAHGNVYDAKGETLEASAPAVNAMASIAQAQTPEELDAMIAAIDSKRSALEEQKKAVDSGTQRAAAEGSSKTRSQDANLPGEDEVDYSSFSREKLEKEIQRLGMAPVKGSGVNGTVVKADYVRALDSHRAAMAGQTGPSTTPVPL